MTPEPVLLTADEVAQIFRQGPETVRRWAREGKVGSVKTPGGGVRFRRDDIEALLSGGTPEPSEAGAV